MAGQKSHIEKCENHILTYKRLFDKHKVIFSQMQNGHFAVIATAVSGYKYKYSFPTHSELIRFLDKVAEKI